MLEFIVLNFLHLYQTILRMELRTAEKMGDEKAINCQKSPKKSNKPQMEKKRRERINNSLDELKLLILGAMKKDASYYSKLEKADILEMAVDHVRNLQKQIRSVQSPDADPIAKYRAGFITCASEVTRMVMGFPGLDESVKFNVMKHLAKCCTTDQRPVIDAKIKQEVTHASVIRQDTRTGHMRNQEGKPDQANQDSKLESIRGQHESVQGQDIMTDPLLSHERSNLITSTTQCTLLEPKTVVEKRLMYQHLLSRAGAARKVGSPDSRIPLSQCPVGTFDFRADEQKLQQLSPNLKCINKYPTILPWNSSGHTNAASTETLKSSPTSTSVPWANATKLYTDSNNNTKVNLGLKMPQKIRKTDGNLIKPVPQLPDKYLISGGIQLMPATVLVPVQVGYAPLDEYKHNSQVEGRKRARDVWRPWERVEAINGRSKRIQSQGIFSL